jgi:ABC-type Fe3+-siderophore transport system permease subunit
LVCEVRKPRSFLATITVIIPRAEVREVRVLPDEGKYAAIGAGIGAGAGAVTVGIHSKSNRGVDAFFGALAGAGVGALAGAFVSLFQLVIQRGKTIYKA